jgi:hypothetical protein
MNVGPDDVAPFSINGDNLFFEDDREMLGDMWLGLWGVSDGKRLIGFWD